MSKDNNQTCALRKKTSIGGQALMEGIMMRGPEKSAMAVRDAQGNIILESSPNKKPSKAAKIPFVRGIVNMVTSLVGGYKYLMRSADIALADADAADKAAKAEKEAAKQAKETAEAADGISSAEEIKTNTSCETAETTETIETTETVETVENDEITTVAKAEGEPTPSVSTEEATVADTADTVPAEEAIRTDEKKPEEKKKEGTGFTTVIVMVVGVVLGLALALFLFRFLPSLLYDGLDFLIPYDLKQDGFGFDLMRSAFEGVTKIIILVLYMFLVSRMKEIRRVFMYHGAEHKTIFCYEAGLELTVENVRLQRRFHPRCGTSFIILVLIVSIVIGCFIPAGLHTLLRTLIGVALLPLTVGIGYELIKLAGRKDNFLTRIISAPGVLLQHITTVEPDDSMIECAIAAMNEVIPEDKSKDNW